MIHLILTAFFPLIGLILLGYVLRRSEWLSPAFWPNAEKLNYYVFFPVMLFLNLASARIELNIIQDVVVVTSLVAFIACIVLYSLRRFYQTTFARFGVYVQSILRFNTYIGLATISSLFQQQGMAIFAVVMVFFIPLVNIISVLSFSRGRHLSVGHILLDLFKNPLILGCIVGGLFNLSGLSLWQGIEGLLKQMAWCSLPLGLMCVGAALQFKAIRYDIWPIFLNTASRLVLMPILALIVCILLNVPVFTMQVLVLFFALPVASASYILTKVYGGDSELMASIISIQTVMGIFSLPIVLTLLFHYFS